MKLIKSLPEGGWDTATYFKYLHANEAAFPPEVFQFASDQSNYALDSHHSLHDAWLESFCIKEISAGSRSEIRTLQIESWYLGPYHDSRIQLVYHDVLRYALATPDTFASAPRNFVGHGDLLMHEVRAGQQGDVIHELLFSRGSTFEISCKSFTHRLAAIDDSS